MEYESLLNKKVVFKKMAHTHRESAFLTPEMRPIGEERIRILSNLYTMDKVNYHYPFQVY